jgi:hypothetical protein
VTAHKRIQEVEARVVGQETILVGAWARVDRLGDTVDMVSLEVLEMQAGVASGEALEVEAEEVLAAAVVGEEDNPSNIRNLDFAGDGKTHSFFCNPTFQIEIFYDPTS